MHPTASLVTANSKTSARSTPKKTKQRYSAREVWTRKRHRNSNMKEQFYNMLDHSFIMRNDGRKNKINCFKIDLFNFILV